ncbi:MAG TPA: DegT/DnrJ/EryC1/StrS aminotransferase family protein [Burkholderiales bacterium]|nr:DegT/DnrJ/EryC1/StrS aminotransferase family protein [Burkholderiales bacterium]
MADYLPFARPLLDAETIDGAAEVLRSGWIASGPQVLAFEHALSDYCGGRPVRVMNSATAALEIALRVCGIGPGDEVITSAESFFAAPNMIIRVGARPVFVDCDLLTRNIDLDQVEAAITPRTRAILPTHFSGLPVDMERLYEIAHRHKLRVIEDAALAIGSSWRGRRIGAFGDLVVFSFHPNKNMTTIEGGALVVNDGDEAKLAEKLRFHGIVRLADGTRDVDVAAGKFNLPDVNARIGLSQLRRLDGFIATRRALAEHYFKSLKTEPPCVPPARGHPGDAAGHSWNMFTVLLPLGRIGITRKQFIDAMHARGIGIGISYEALHLSTLCRGFGYHPGDFPNAERIARETVTLPLFPAMTVADVERVCADTAAVIAGAAR